MKAMYLALAAMCSALIAPATVSAQVGPGLLEAAVAEEIVVVRAVDQDARKVTVEAPGGSLVTINVPPQSQNLDQVHPGARFRVRYLQAVALFVSKSGDIPSAQQVSTIQMAEKGATPGGVIVDIRQIEARIDTIDYQERTVVLTGPDGGQFKLAVDDRVQGFDAVQAGDMVVVRYTEALAMTMIMQ